MTDKKFNRLRKLKILALVVGFIILGGLIAVYVGYRQVVENPQRYA